MKIELNNKVLTLGVVVILLWLGACNSKNSLGDYKGLPYKDDIYKGTYQNVPGKVQAEFYDLGGEGVAFHDTDSVNSGSGNLNKANGSYLNEFRINEPVDISYTKFQDPPVDNSEFNFVEPEKDQLYVGWTKPGEWTKYTINVEIEGTYELGLMYTSNQNGKISFSVNDIDITGPLDVLSTYVAADTIAWRQWHHWNYVDNIASVKLKKGLQTFTIHTVDIGDMNYDYINFKIAE